jgi:hypothetical protein
VCGEGFHEDVFDIDTLEHFQVRRARVRRQLSTSVHLGEGHIRAELYGLNVEMTEIRGDSRGMVEMSTISNIAECVALATQLKRDWFSHEPTWGPWFRGHRDVAWKSTRNYIA